MPTPYATVIGSSIAFSTTGTDITRVWDCNNDVHHLGVFTISTVYSTLYSNDTVKGDTDALWAAITTPENWDAIGEGHTQYFRWEGGGSSVSQIWDESLGSPFGQNWFYGTGGDTPVNYLTIGNGVVGDAAMLRWGGKLWLSWYHAPHATIENSSY